MGCQKYDNVPKMDTSHCFLGTVICKFDNDIIFCVVVQKTSLIKMSFVIFTLFWHLCYRLKFSNWFDR